jgi:hypothetical protein
MRIRRTERDMFGRAAPVPAPVSRQASPHGRRQLPPGLVPFLPVITLVVVLAAIVLVPVAGVALLVLVVAGVLTAILRARYRDVKELDYLPMRGGNPLWRAMDDREREQARSERRPG